MLQSGELSELVEETVPWWKVERESGYVCYGSIYIMKTVVLSMDKNLIQLVSSMSFHKMLHVTIELCFTDLITI